MPKYSFIPVLLLFCLNACTSYSSNDAVYHNQFNFNQVKSYSIYPRNSVFTDAQNLSDSERNSIEIAIEKSMEQQQFQHAAITDADIIVTYHIIGRDPGGYSRYNKAVLFCQSCLKANNWYNGKRGLKLSRGSLVIDLVDPKKKRSIWRSAQSLKIKDKDNSRQVNDKIQQAVDSMLQQYPTATYH